MPLWCAAILLIICLAGGFFARRKWISERKRGFMALWIFLYIASAVLAIYMAMICILINAVR